MWANTTLQPAAQAYPGQAIVKPRRCIINSCQHSAWPRSFFYRHSRGYSLRTVHVQCQPFHPRSQVDSLFSYRPREPAAGIQFDEFNNGITSAVADSDEENNLKQGRKVWSDDLSQKDDNGLNDSEYHRESKLNGAMIKDLAGKRHSNGLQVVERQVVSNAGDGDAKTDVDEAAMEPDISKVQPPIQPQLPPSSIPIPPVAVDSEEEQVAAMTNDDLAQMRLKDMQTSDVAKEVAEDSLGVTIQVAYPSSINTSRERHWALLKELVPPDEWQDTAVVLACLESIYRAEYLQFGQAAMAVLQAANAIRTQSGVQEPASQKGRNGSSPPMTNLEVAAQAVANGINSNGTHASHVVNTQQPSQIYSANASSNSNGLYHAQIGAEHEEQMKSELAALSVMFGSQPRNATRDDERPEQAERTAGETAEEAADRMDNELAGLLAFLSSRSQFQPLTVRDVEIARTLNRDYLFQLFIVGDMHRMDTAWVDKLQEAGMYSNAHRTATYDDLSSLLDMKSYDNNPVTRKEAEEAAVAAAAALGLGEETAKDEDKQPSSSSSDSSSEADNESDLGDTGLLLAEECESLLLLKRNWGHEDVTGRLIVQKLDYLQTLVVALVADSARNTLSAAGSWVRGLFPRHSDDSKGDDKQAAHFDLGSRQRTGSSWAQWLDDKGVWPRLHTLSLRDIDTLLPLPEPRQLPPLTLRKVALAEVLGAQPFRQHLGSLLRILFQPVTLQQPTIKELVVAYRRLPDNQTTAAMLLARARKVGQRLRLLPKTPITRPAGPRPPIQIRVYRDIPAAALVAGPIQQQQHVASPCYHLCLQLPTWQLTLPDKKLQFRPLDLLRADLFALTGLVALLAQAKYESLLLDIITFVSATVFLIRIALGFKRMDDRYRNQVAEVLREKTVASDGPALEYLAAAAALQQFKQASLAYVHGLQAKQHATASIAKQPQAAASVQIASKRGKSDATAEKVKRIRKSDVRSQPGVDGEGVSAQQRIDDNNHRDANGSCITSDRLPTAMEQLLWKQCGLKVMFDGEQAISELLRLGLAEECRRGVSLKSSTTSGSVLTQRSYRVVSRDKALDILQRHWGQLLWQRAKGILREFE